MHHTFDLCYYNVGAWFYYYAPGESVDRHGGGIKIPLSSDFGQ